MLKPMFRLMKYNQKSFDIKGKSHFYSLLDVENSKEKIVSYKYIIHEIFDMKILLSILCLG